MEKLKNTPEEIAAIKAKTLAFNESSQCVMVNDFFENVEKLLSERPLPENIDSNINESLRIIQRYCPYIDIIKVRSRVKALYDQHGVHCPAL